MSSQRRPEQENSIERNIKMKTKLIKMITSCSLFACALVSVTAAMVLSTSSVARAERTPASCGIDTPHASYIFDAHRYKHRGGGASTQNNLERKELHGSGTLVSP